MNLKKNLHKSDKTIKISYDSAKTSDPDAQIKLVHD